MRCSICDRVLQPDEVKLNSQYGEFDPCGTCLAVIDDVFSDPLDEDEVTYLLEHETEEEEIIP